MSSAYIHTLETFFSEGIHLMTNNVHIRVTVTVNTNTHQTPTKDLANTNNIPLSFIKHMHSRTLTPNIAIWLSLR